jgi:putative transposase
MFYMHLFLCHSFEQIESGACAERQTGPMNDYRNNRVPGGTFFFTVRLLDRHSALLTEHIAAFGEAIRQARLRFPFHVDAWVVLPDHSHAVWTLPPGDVDCSVRWNAVKIAFSKALRKTRASGWCGKSIWTRHFQQFAVSDDTEYQRLVDYVHDNPLRHGLCSHALHWPWSSVHRFLDSGLIV